MGIMKELSDAENLAEAIEEQTVTVLKQKNALEESVKNLKQQIEQLEESEKVLESLCRLALSVIATELEKELHV